MILRNFRQPVYILALLLAVPAASARHARAQTVTNVRQYRISDDEITVWYDLASNAPTGIGIAASFDGGSSFTYRPRTASGDVGPAVTPGTGKRIVWNLAGEERDIPGDVVVRVFASGAVIGPVAVPPAEGGGRKEVTALGIDTPVRFDGLLTEPFWKDAQPATGFTQRELTEGAPATERTEVRIVFDEDNLYIGVTCFDADPSGIIHNELQRDVKLDSDDSFTLVLDTFDSYRNGYFFAINPNGARHDGFFYGSELINNDWDGVWDAAAEITPCGWSAEIVIPFKTLRFPNRSVQAWGINFRRVIRRKSEEVLWSSWRRDDGIFQLTKAGLLVGMEGVKKGRRLEFIPYLLAGAERADGEDDSDFKYGLDVRYPLTTDLSLDITTHTDFAQVETDRERINLTRFSLFYPEKRDFFLAGSEIFDYDTGYFEKVYHSRRIGLDENREQIPILGGLNLAGKAGKYSIGVLNIQTDGKGGTPGTNYSVVRIKRDILEKSRIGFIATNLYDRNEHTNRTVGGDFFYQTNRLFGDKNFGIRGDLTGSFTDGESDDNLFGRLFIDFPNDLVDTFFELYHVGAGFNPEMGFITRRGIRRVNGKVRFFPRPGIPHISRLIFMPLGLNYIADLDGRMLERKVSFWPFGFYTNANDKLQFTIERSYDLVEDDFVIFGDTVIGAAAYEWTTWGVDIESSGSRPLSASFIGRMGDFYGGEREIYNPGLTFKLNKNLAVTGDFLYNDITLGGDHLIAKEYGAKVNLSLSTKLTSSTFVQYNNETDEVNMNFRLHFIPNMGSDLYLVYNHLWDESRDFATKYRTGIVKVDYLFRM